MYEADIFEKKEEKQKKMTNRNKNRKERIGIMHNIKTKMKNKLFKIT